MVDIKILKEVNMPLLARKRYTLEIEFDGPTPRKDELKKAVANALKAKGELVALRHAYNRYGLRKFRTIAHVYSKEESFRLLETKKKKNDKKESKKQDAEQKV
jgi:small subunit ribosomal protein S24e